MEKMKKICKTIKGDRQLLAGMIGIVILLALVILAPVVASENPHHYGKDILNSLGQNGHLLGTNHMGQDIYSMIIYGVRTSLRVAVISALISGVLGVPVSYTHLDGKSQVTVEYGEDGKPARLEAVVLSTQHDPAISQEQIHEDIRKYVFDPVLDPKMIDENTKFFINPTGRAIPP